MPLWVWQDAQCTCRTPSSRWTSTTSYCSASSTTKSEKTHQRNWSLHPVHQETRIFQHVDEGSESSDSVASPMDVREDTTDFLDVEAGLDEPDIVSAAINGSVAIVKAAVWAEWQTERGAVSDDESEDENGDIHESSEDGLTEDEDDIVEDDNQSVDDRIEAEWENEWAEMGTSFHFYTQALYHLINPHIRRGTYRGRYYVSSGFCIQNRGKFVRQVL